MSITNIPPTIQVQGVMPVIQPGIHPLIVETVRMNVHWYDVQQAININIRNFDDHVCQKKLQKYFNNHRGTNVSIKELKMNDLVCDANNKLLNQLRSFKYRQWKNHRIYQLLRSAKELLKMQSTIGKFHPDRKDSFYCHLNDVLPSCFQDIFSIILPNSP